MLARLWASLSCWCMYRFVPKPPTSRIAYKGWSGVLARYGRDLTDLDVVTFVLYLVDLLFY
jgi:hypothetical protein